MLKMLGFVSRKERVDGISGSPFIPMFSFYEAHESGALIAKPEEIIAAASAFDMRADKVADLLISFREWPSKLTRLFQKDRSEKNPSLFGFDKFTLLRRDGHELSLGLVGRFWRPDLELTEIADAKQFEQIDEPTVAKLVLRYQVIERPGNVRTLRTETFVYCPNTRTKLLFTPYWLAIRPISGWLRRRSLASIERTLSANLG